MPQGFSTDERREQETLTTLFDLGRQVTAVLDFDELLAQIPTLIGRLIQFDAFAVYLLDERRGELRVAYSVGYPEHAEPMRLALGQGLVGEAVRSQMPLMVNDVSADPRYVGVVGGMAAELVVPLLHKKRPIGALNLLSHQTDAFTAGRCRSAPAVRRPRRRRDRQRALVRAEPLRRRSVRNAGRNRPRRRGRPRRRRAVRAHRAADEARDRLPHVRHLAA